MHPRVFVVYVIQNRLDGKRYIGKTSGRSVLVAVETRWKGHLRLALSGGGSRLHRAMRKHGVQNFEIGYLHICKTECGAFALEVREIARLAPGYNLTKGGEGITGFRHTDEARARMSGPRSPMKPEQKEKLRQAHLGKPKTREHALKISLGKTGKPCIRTKLSATGIAIKQAQDVGLKFYSTGIPCDMGHVSPRYISTSQCCECHRLRYLDSVGGTYKGRYRGLRSAEFKAAVSRTMKGKPKTPETRAKMAIAARIREAARRNKMEIEHHV